MTVRARRCAAAIPCVVDADVPLDELRALLDTALLAAPFQRRDRWWRVDEGGATIINEPSGRVWIEWTERPEGMSVYFDRPDDYVGDAKIELIMRSWRDSLAEAILESSDAGQRLMAGPRVGAELLVAAGVAAGNEGVSSHCASSFTTVEGRRFQMSAPGRHIPMTEALGALIERSAPPFRRLRGSDRFVEDGMIIAFRDQQTMGPVTILRLVSDLPMSLVDELREACGPVRPITDYQV